MTLFGTWKASSSVEVFLSPEAFEAYLNVAGTC